MRLRLVLFNHSFCREDCTRANFRLHPYLTLIPQNKLSSAKFLTLFNFQSASMSLKGNANVI